MNTDHRYRFWCRLAWLLLRPFHRVRAIGAEHLPEGGAVVCPNHCGLLDPIYVCFAATCRRRMYPMAKAELRRVPFLGALLKSVGVIFVDRGEADIRAVKASLQILKDGKKLLLFPQGTRVKNGLDKNGRPVEPKQGAALFATRTATPLIPVWVQEDRRLFRSVTVVFGAPYVPEIAGKKATGEELEQITRELMARITALREEIK